MGGITAPYALSGCCPPCIAFVLNFKPLSLIIKIVSTNVSLSFGESNEGVLLSIITNIMKIRTLCLFFLLLSFSCKKDYKLTFEPVTHTSTICAGCPLVSITIPKALEEAKIDSVVNNALKEEIIYLLNFNEDNEATDIESAIASFSEGYADLKARFAEEATPWEAKLEGTISYEDKNILTIKLDSYIFTGGAHGYNTTHFLNFDKVKAFELDNEDLFKNPIDFQSFAETKFRLQEKIPAEGDINTTGFMFETNAFYLPQNIGHTQEGITLFYEQYEIASYADGPIVLSIPYAELKNYLVYHPREK